MACSRGSVDTHTHTHLVSQYLLHSLSVNVNVNQEILTRLKQPDALRSGGERNKLTGEVRSLLDDIHCFR